MKTAYDTGMEGALRDWLLGCNPWGVSMVVELPRGGTYPLQPHSFIINEKLGNTTGGLVDGPVYDTIFGSLLGIHTDGGNNYEAFQPGRMVYHDSTHDYSTNEPTMDGTASLTFPLSAYQMEGRNGALPAPSGVSPKNVFNQGGIVRTDPSQKRISLVFTAADKADGAPAILSALRQAGVKGAFFFTGEFFEKFPSVVRDIQAGGHYVGSHSYGHLLYCPWGKGRDSLLVTREEFETPPSPPGRVPWACRWSITPAGPIPTETTPRPTWRTTIAANSSWTRFSPLRKKRG